jgi:NAD(P)-dependent dehydrogenase (short-subunit alcohol dehydrogenase family)
MTSPKDVANAVYLLCRPEAIWINGTILKVDGGESLR